MNSYMRLIHEYMDRNLEGYLEELLFKELAINSELRQEFAEQIRLHQIVQKDMALIAPPQQAMAELFSNLGIEVPALPAETTIPASGIASSFSRFFPSLAKYLPYAMVAVVSSLLTLGATYIRPESASNTSVSHTPSATQQIQQAQQTQMTNAPGVAQEQVRHGSDHHSSTAFSHRADGASIGTHQEQENIPASTDRPAAMSSPDISAASSVSIAHASWQSQQEKRMVPVFRSNMPSLVPVVDEELPIIVQLHRAGGTAEANTGDGIPFTDMPVDVLYQLSPNQYIGVEFAREHFQQDYQQTIDGERMDISRNTLLPCFGFIYNQKLPELSPIASLVPFGQVFAGGTPEGLLGRMIVGLQYEPEQRIALMAGIEGSILPYTVQQQWYVTRKLGLTYGISVKF